jgi:hypothetical protein
MMQPIHLGILGLQFSQTSNGGTNGDCRWGRERVSSSGHSLTARTARPDSSAGTLDSVLSAKDTLVRRVLRNFNLSQQLTQSGTVSGSILSCDSDLLRASSHFDELKCFVSDGAKVMDLCEQIEFGKNDD